VHEKLVIWVEYSESLRAHDADLGRCVEIFSEERLKNELKTS
jgi:hypothetical protein